MLLYLDLSTGASGDKLLGALLELCEALELTSFAELEAKAHLLLPAVQITRTHVQRGGIGATHLSVYEEEARQKSSFEHNVTIEHCATQGHSHQHQHEHEHEHERSRPHEHQHQHEHDAQHEHEPAHLEQRTWAQIRALLAQAAQLTIVSPATAKAATCAFERVALAEAKVHNVPVDEVHFHEVGAADSIIDLLFCCHLFELLAPTEVLATPLALGNGSVHCAHGELMVPAPATLEIVTGAGQNCTVAAYASCHPGELTTPTGAALVAQWVTGFAALPYVTPLAVGYGAGSREINGAANVVRALAAVPLSPTGLAAKPAEGLFVEGVVRLECNIDHLSPEALAFVCEELLAEGALDVWQEGIVMKKGRLASKLALLTSTQQAAAFAQRLHELTGSLGVRSEYLERTVLARKTIVLQTPYGPVPYKAAALGAPGSPQRRQWIRPEHDAVAALARKHQRNYTNLAEELGELGKTASWEKLPPA